jgi:hypothetical protein
MPAYRRPERRESLSAGTILAGHRIEGIIGQGGMGIVYRATQLALNRTVALKVILPDFAQNEEFRKRFETESQLAAEIDHPHVIPVYHAGEEDEVLFVTMRYVKGTDLKALIADRGPLDLSLVVAVVNGVGAALDAAHSHDLVHRDVKPGNILIVLSASPHPYLTDFGLTKRTKAVTGLTRTGEWVGTLDYVAPEQIDSEHVDGRADVYALGCVVYEALTGQVPFPGGAQTAKLWAHMSRQPPLVTDRRPDVPRVLDRIVRRAMAKRPEDRYQTAGELGAAVAAAGTGAPARGGRTRRLLGRVGSPAAREPAAQAAALGASRLRRPRQPARVALAGAACLVAVAAAVATVLALGDQGESTATYVDVPAQPVDLALGGSGLWVAATDKTVSRIDPATTKVVGRRVHVSDAPTYVVTGAGSVWVATFNKQLLRIDPARSQVVGESLHLSGAAYSMAYGYGSIWVPDGEHHVERITPGGSRRSISVGRAPYGVAIGAGGVWIVNRADGTVTRIDPKRNRVAKPILVPPGSEDLAIGQGRIWVLNPADGTLVRIDPSSRRRVGKTIRVGREARDVAVDDEAAWVAGPGRRLSRVRVSGSNASVSRVELRADPDELAVGGGVVWVAVSGGGGQVVRVDPRTAF